LIRPLADQADVRLRAEPSKLADLHVNADQQRLKQVLINLLSNAVKYNRPGGEVRVETTPPVHGLVEVAVSDTGPGMTAEQLERLFDPFDRLGAESGDVEGTGLGLSLSIGLMRAMGGTIRAVSEPGAGTTMRVELDTRPGAASEQQAPDAARSRPALPTPEGRTVLHVEDNLSNLTLVEQTLERLPGIRLIPAMYGKLGIELAREHRPDLVLLDLHMPDLHGHEVLARLKGDPATREIPVVVISADATPTQVDSLLAAGAVEYLTKPIDVEQLLDVVAGNLATATAAGGS
jgi:CheY-like chemotaxis protein/anti-sigma regulatory factor (Ser/Thr protein kinase)